MICLKDRSFFNSWKNRKRATLYFFFFFPDYKALGILKRQFPNASLIGLTATATSHVLKDAQKILCVEKCFTFTASFNRPNLYYEVCNSMSVYFVKDFSRVSVQFSRSVVSDSLWPRAAYQASLSITNSRSLHKLMSVESVMPSNHLILCHPLLLLPSIFPSIRVFSKFTFSLCLFTWVMLLLLLSRFSRVRLCATP